MSEPHSTGSVPAEKHVLRQNWGPNYHRTLASIPVPPEQAEKLLCPVLTLHNKSIEELTNKEVPEIRAYKLGKKRWSYNQFEIRVQNEIGAAHFDVKEALQSSTPPSLQQLSDACASYKVRLVNGLSIIVHAFMVFEHALDVIVTEGDVQKTFYQWVCVDRSACKKGCSGPVLRPIQRFGRVGKRSGPEAPKNQAGQLKNYKYMYLSMDEAGTHVGGCRFRMLFCAYDETGSTMLGTSVSVPIKVLANNDVPTGAAHVPVNITLRSDWVGWYNVSPGMLQKSYSNVHNLLMREDDDVDMGPFGPRYVPEPEPLDEAFMPDDEEECHGCGTGREKHAGLFPDLGQFPEAFGDAEHAAQLRMEAEEHERIVREMGLTGHLGHMDELPSLTPGVPQGPSRGAPAGGASPEVVPRKGGRVPHPSPGNSNFSEHTNSEHVGYPSPLGPPANKRAHDQLMDAAPGRIATRPGTKRQRVSVEAYAGVPDLSNVLPPMPAPEGAPVGPNGAGPAQEITLIDIQAHPQSAAQWMPATGGPGGALQRTCTATSAGLLLPTDTPMWQPFSPGGFTKLNFDGELHHTPLEGTLSGAAQELLMGHLGDLPEHMDPLGEFGTPRDRLNSLFNTPHAGLTPRGFEQIFQTLPAQ